MNMIRLSLGLGCLMVVVGITSSCTPSSHENGAASSENASVPGSVATTRSNQAQEDKARHWVQNVELRRVMKDLSAKSQRNWPKDVPQDPESQATGDLHNTLESAAKLAEGLAAAAERLPESVTNAKMSEADRAGFQAEANTLRDQAIRLGQAARAKKVENMQQSLDDISATCISCHSRYRDFSGQLSIQQASAAAARQPW